MTEEEANDLLTKYQSGACTEEELAWVESWYLTLNEEKVIDLSKIDFEASTSKLRLSLGIQDSRTVPLWKKLSVAVSILFVTTLSFYYIHQKDSAKQNASTLVSAPIQPGGNKAVLILDDGSEIDLEKTSEEKLSGLSGVSIGKSASGQVAYSMSGSKGSAAPQGSFHTIVTPKGGTFQVLLEDGSKVWLNSASSIRFPVSFLPGERIVELKGEAYFEIAKNPARPFTVKLADQTVRVLGTKFNVNSYSNEETVATTLLEGSVRISNQVGSLILQPGQQSQSTTNQKIRSREVDVEEFLGWKDGMFYFKRTDIHVVMRQFERWYNISIVIEKDVPKTDFTGKIYRNLTLNEALKNIEFMGLKFKIENRNVTVLSK